MRVLVEKDDGTTLEVKEINAVSENADTLLFFAAIALKRDRISEMESELTNKIGKRCVIIPWGVSNVVGLTGGPEQRNE